MLEVGLLPLPVIITRMGCALMEFVLSGIPKLGYSKLHKTAHRIS